MYLIGNAETYSNVPMWDKVLGMLRANDAVSKAFSLQCPRHPETMIEASKPEDFARFSPEGGCSLSCGQRLECGHVCSARCHSESMHNVFTCPEPCQRLHTPCNHICQEPTCGEPCGLCMIKLNGVQLPCGHSKDGIFCHQTLDLTKIRCNTLVQKRVPSCNHLINTECSRDVTSVLFSCSTACKTLLSCGHTCPGTCGKCSGRDVNGQLVAHHAPCNKKCDRPFSTCNHRCTKFCHTGQECGPCVLKCEVRNMD